MYWKVSVDLSQPLVSSEGNLDPIDGYVVFKLLQRTAGETSILKEEIDDYYKILVTKVPRYSSDDPLDLGMTLWTAHWLSEEEEWAASLSQKASQCLRTLSTSEDYFDLPLHYRLAFREFGTVLGIRCLNECGLDVGNYKEEKVGLETTPPPPPLLTGIDQSRQESHMHVDFCALARKTLAAWESVGIVPSPSDGAPIDKDLVPITCVMYAASLYPGGKYRYFL